MSTNANALLSKKQPMKPDAIIHPTAICESQAVGPGTHIWAFAHVMADSAIGEDCQVCDRAFVESGARVGNRVTIKNGAMIWKGVTIDDDVFIGPAVVFTNDRYPRSSRMPEIGERYESTANWLERTQVRRGASIGAGSIVMCGVTIGEFASVGAGSLVTHDVPAHGLVLGRPAQRVDWVCVCGVPLKNGLTCRACSRSFEVSPDGIVLSDAPVPKARLDTRETAVAPRCAAN